MKPLTAVESTALGIAGVPARLVDIDSAGGPDPGALPEGIGIAVAVLPLELALGAAVL